jgi:hypothetical protein
MAAILNNLAIFDAEKDGGFVALADSPRQTTGKNARNDGMVQTMRPCPTTDADTSSKQIFFGITSSSKLSSSHIDLHSVYNQCQHLLARLL